MSYIDDFIRYHLNPKYCETLKKELIQRLKDDMRFNEKTTEVDVLSNFDITTNKHKLLVIIDRTPLIELEIDVNSSTSETTWKVMKAYNERFGDVNGR